MPQGTKIATCSYCGTRAALVLTGTVRHELSCASCGAPLHEIKLMPMGDAPARPIAKPAPKKQRPTVNATPLPVWERPKYEAPRKRKKKKTKKGLARKFLSEAFDVLEDIFD